MGFADIAVSTQVANVTDLQMSRRTVEGDEGGEGQARQQPVAQRRAQPRQADAEQACAASPAAKSALLFLCCSVTILYLFCAVHVIARSRGIISSRRRHERQACGGRAGGAGARACAHPIAYACARALPRRLERVCMIEANALTLSAPRKWS